MPRAVRPPRKKRKAVSPGLRHYLEHGRGGTDAEGEPLDGSIDRYMLSDAQCEAVWREHAEAWLAEWAETRPGTRPWAWWRWDAPGAGPPSYGFRWIDARRHVGGSGRVLDGEPEGAASADTFAEPEFEPGSVDPADWPRIESQAAYLRRHKLLLPSERRRKLPAVEVMEFDLDHYAVAGWDVELLGPEPTP